MVSNLYNLHNFNRMQLHIIVNKSERGKRKNLTMQDELVGHSDGKYLDKDRVEDSEVDL